MKNNICKKCGVIYTPPYTNQRLKDISVICPNCVYKINNKQDIGKTYKGKWKKGIDILVSKPNKHSTISIKHNAKMDIDKILTDGMSEHNIKAINKYKDTKGIAEISKEKLIEYNRQIIMRKKGKE